MKFYILVSTVFFITFLHAQTSKQKKIKIVLMGTLHFEPSETDVFKNNALSIFSDQKQKEIEKVVGKISNFNPSQICVEYPITKQKKLDSLYNEYQNDRFRLTKNEIHQLGFKASKKTNLSRVTAINYYGDFDFEKVVHYAKNSKQENIISNFNQYGKTFMDVINNELEISTIKDFLLMINTEEFLQKNALMYSKYFVTIGKNTEYVGTDLVAGWYKTNLYIYTNILRQIRPNDDKILVIFGQGHIPILKHLFSTNPDFEVVSVSDILN